MKEPAPTTAPSYVVELPVLRWGIGSPRRVLLIHGVASSGAGWSGVATRLAAAGVEAWAPDLRGHGSAPRADRYRVADLAGDLAALAPSWDAVVGHSLGGPVALALAAAGTPVGRLVLLDPVMHIDDADLPAIVADQLTESDPFADPAALAAAHPDWPAEDAWAKAMAMRQVAPHTIRSVFADNAPWQMLPLLDRVDAPIDVLRADPEVFTLFPEAHAAAARARAPQLHDRIVVGCGHGIHRTRPDVVAATVLDGLRAAAG
ncbi:MAG: alpha/beta hydrolase [Chloroflexota bacterium]